MAVGLRETVIAPRLSRALCVLVVAMCLTVIGALVTLGRVEPILRYTPAALLVAAVAIVVFWLPRVRIGPTGVEIVNPFRTHAASWPAVVDVETKWTLTVVTAVRRIQVWAAPGPGLLGSIGSVRRDPRGGLVLDAAADRTPPRAVGDVAAVLVLRQWRDHRDDAPETEGSGTSARTHVAEIAVLSTLAVLTLAGLLWP